MGRNSDPECGLSLLTRAISGFLRRGMKPAPTGSFIIMPKRLMVSRFQHASARLACFTNLLTADP